MTTIDDVKARLDLVETVSSYVPELKQTGRNWKARCPFHSEKTPSFVVDPGRGTWHCFGSCSTGGDVIEFVRRVEGLEFRDALRLCADRAGVELRAPSAREREDKEQHERLLRANEAAAVFFRAALDGPEGADARAYLENRGLDEATIERWQLGYAPDDWRALSDHLTARGFTIPDLVEAGLVIEGDRGAYDRFRHRLIVPTRDQRRRLIGFGARALRPEDEPKYLNTPQTPLFDKSGSLYGIDQAFEPIRRADRAIVVEGYMDVIAAHQFGFTNTIASMGTALTEKQMALLKRFSRNIVLALDADEAGSEATLRGVQIAANAADHEQVATVDWRGLVSYQDSLKADIRVVSLSDGEDPDSLIRQDPDQFRALLDGALPVTDHLFKTIGDQTDANNPRERSQAVEALAPTVAAIVDPVVRSHYIQRLARLGGIDERMALQLVTRGSAARPQAVATPNEVRRSKTQPSVAPDGETQILQLLIQHSECRASGLELDPDLFEDGVNRGLFDAWYRLENLAERSEDLDETLAERLQVLTEAETPDYEPRHLVALIADMARVLRQRRTKQRLKEAGSDAANAYREAKASGAHVDEAAARTVADGEIPAGVRNEDADVASELVAINDRMRNVIRQERDELSSPDSAKESLEPAEQSVESVESVESLESEQSEQSAEPVEVSP
jgi:DNA primase